MVWSYGWAVLVEFLSDQEAAGFGRCGGSVSQADLERFFYLDDTDRKVVAGQREDHNRLGFSVQLATVRYIGRFLADPLEGCRSRSSTSWPDSSRSLIRRA
jgi:TnpA family transposase